MRIATVANGKGGCGKTTVATNLASALANAGARVGLADADPQRSALSWLARRPNAAASIAPFDWSRNAPSSDELEVLRSEAGLDWLIVDAPGALFAAPRSRHRAYAALSEADLVIAPIAPSFFDEQATRAFLARLESLPAVRAGRSDLMLVANRLRKNARRSAKPRKWPDLAEFFERLTEAPAARLRERAAYPALAERGLGLFDSAAARQAEHRAEWRGLLDAFANAAAATRSA